MAGIVLPEEYKYVLATIGASNIVSLMHGFLTGSARNAANVPYPNAYATHDEAVKDPAKFAFNCAQRAHANYLESYPIFLSSLLVAGTKYPLVTSAMGAAWLTGRVLYAFGYKNSKHNSKGEGRYKGIIAPLVQFPMMGLALWTTYQLVMSA
ncbi:hypothetical protein BDZ91DRAFT_54524 [Kalaharituber pfeilii]|nr:hypothetical protein BDZ91DRAFT_54524 [Kalaharituber pfeilii]